MTKNGVRRSAACALLWIFGAACAAEGGDGRRLPVPDDYYRLQAVGSPDVAPDGQWVAYAVTGADRDADESRSQLWMVSWDGLQHVALTNPAKGTRSPRFSPDGRYLAYLAKPVGGDDVQLMVQDRRGGEARAVTATHEVIEDYAWAPDGRRIVLVVSHGDAEPASSATPPAAGPASAPPAKRPRPIVIDAQHFKDDDEGYLATGHRRHLWLLTVDSGALTPLTKDEEWNDDHPAWSPDGRQLVYVRTHASGGVDRDGKQDIAIIDAGGESAARTIARVYGGNGQRLGYTRDGRAVAYLLGRESRYSAYVQNRLALLDLADGTSRVLTAALDRAVSSYAFATDPGTALITVDDDGAGYVASVDLQSSRVTRIAGGRFIATGIVAGGGHAAVLYTDLTTPREISALEGTALRRLTTHNDALMAELRLGAVEALSFRSRDGTEVHGYATLPADAVAGRRYPVILWIHGGPNGQDGYGLSSYDFLRRLYAANGYVALAVNYRGSTGRGQAYADAIYADWGHHEVEDLLAAVDQVVAQGLADPARLAIGGWSYGGILTDYTIASDRRFKAAISGAGSANQLAMYGLDEYVRQYDNELGPPWKTTSLWLKLSYPFFHADRIVTPTLFMGGLLDFNVPVAGSEQMYQALSTLGVPAQLVVYPGEHHGLVRPSFVKDRAERLLAWYARYLGPSP